MKLKKAIFFDRDGVLIHAPIKNNKPISIQNIKKLKFCMGIKKLCKFYKKNYLLIMVTNQPDFVRKKNTKKNITEINQYIKKMLEPLGFNLAKLKAAKPEQKRHIIRVPTTSIKEFKKILA